MCGEKICAKRGIGGGFVPGRGFLGESFYSRRGGFVLGGGFGGEDLCQNCRLGGFVLGGGNWGEKICARRGDWGDLC